MRIEWIELENFKGFDKRRFEFDEHFTLIVGENGSGKTSAVMAIGEILRAWCASFSMGTGIDYEEERDKLRLDTAVLASGRVVSYALPLQIRACLVVGESTLLLESHSDGGDHTVIFKGLQAGMLGCTERLRLDGVQFNHQLPVCAWYPASRDFGAATPDWSQIMAARPFRSEGYRDLAVSTAASKGLFEWMGRQEAIGNEEGHDAPGYTSVKNAMTSALPDSQEVWFSAKLGEPAIKWRSNLVIPYSKLSDGQKAVITIAGDISRRAALLNPHLDDPVSETPGVVLIDEIDLHLHPRWQRRIMEDLRRVFPRIQFIATTHSPIIISAAKDAKVINLDANGSHEISQAYGMDVNWVVDIIQGAESQAPEIAALIREADDFIEDGELDEARAIAEKLKILQNGPSPDSVGIGARIDNLIALAHAED